MLDPKHDDNLQSINLGIAEEDIVVVSELSPIKTPETSTRELLVVGDECISAYREKLKVWESQGWRIDVEKILKDRSSITYAIPSPGRRTSSNWVRDAAPLISP